MRGHSIPSPLMGEGWDGGNRWGWECAMGYARILVPSPLRDPCITMGGDAVRGHSIPSPLMGEGWDGGESVGLGMRDGLRKNPLKGEGLG